MKIYFEDGRIDDIPEELKHAVVLDAANGPTVIRGALDGMLATNVEPYCVYTNSLVALNAKYT